MPGCYVFFTAEPNTFASYATGKMWVILGGKTRLKLYAVLEDYDLRRARLPP
jgi:hypothetical protein